MDSEPDICFPEVVSLADRVQLTELARSIWEEHYTPIIGSDQVAYMLETLQSPEAIAEQMREGRRYHLLQKGVTPAGYLAFDHLNGGLFLSKLYVSKAFRGQGLARKSVDWLWASFSPAFIRLTVNRFNEGSIAAYQSLGFIIVDSVQQDIGRGFVMDDYLMEATYRR